MSWSLRGSCSAVYLGCAFAAMGLTSGLAAEVESPRGRAIEAVVRPAVPDELSKRGAESARAVRTPRGVSLSNGFLVVEIDTRDGLIAALENKLTGERNDYAGDEAGFSFTEAAGRPIAWQARAGLEQQFEVEIADDEATGAQLVLSTRTGDGAAQVRLHYQLERGRFWIERRLSVETGAVTYNTLTYGGVRVPNAEVRELKLGKFDAPRLVKIGKGGLFAGVGWWFYETVSIAIQA